MAKVNITHENTVEFISTLAKYSTFIGDLGIERQPHFINCVEKEVERIRSLSHPIWVSLLPGAHTFGVYDLAQGEFVNYSGE